MALRACRDLSTIACSLFLPIVLWACVDSTSAESPSRSMSHTTDESVAPGETMMTMGISHDDGSVELSDGAEMELVWGMQGALHLEAFLEFSMMDQVPRAADLTCNATVNDTMEGYVTISGFPLEPYSAQTFRSGIFFIFLRDTDPGFYRGKEATVSCEVILLGVRYVASHTVTLVDVFD